MFRSSTAAVLDEAERTPPAAGSVHGQSDSGGEPKLTRVCDPSWFIRSEVTPKDRRDFPQCTSIQRIRCNIAAHRIALPFLRAILEVKFVNCSAGIRKAAATKEILKTEFLSREFDRPLELGK